MITIEFKHRKSNFYVYIREKSLISQFSAGNIIGYSEKSSKRQKIKHVSDQLAELVSVRANRIPPNLTRNSPVLYYLYKKYGLISAALNVITKNSLRLQYIKRKPEYNKKNTTRELLKFPSLLSLYSIATRPYLVGRTTIKPNRALRRYARLSQKYRVVFVKKKKFNAKFARKTFFRFIYRKPRKQRLKRLKLHL